MHKSQIKEKATQNDTYRFRSIDKQNFVTVRLCTPAKNKTNVYYQKLHKMQQRHLMTIAKNQKIIEEMKAKYLVYKNISIKQADRFDTSQTNLAKEELHSEVLTYKSEVNRIQDLIAAITQQHEGRRSENERALEEQRRRIDLNVSMIARLQKQIAQSQHLLIKRKQQAEAGRVEISKNQLLIVEKQKQESRYLEAVRMIDSREASRN